MHKKLENGIEIRGWRITANKGTIAREAQVKEYFLLVNDLSYFCRLEASLGLPSLPEMTFTSNYLKLEKLATGFEYSFNCIGCFSFSLGSINSRRLKGGE